MSRHITYKDRNSQLKPSAVAKQQHTQQQVLERTRRPLEDTPERHLHKSHGLAFQASQAPSSNASEVLTPAPHRPQASPTRQWVRSSPAWPDSVSLSIRQRSASPASKRLESLARRIVVDIEDSRIRTQSDTGCNSIHPVRVSWRRHQRRARLDRQPPPGLGLEPAVARNMPRAGYAVVRRNMIGIALASPPCRVAGTAVQRNRTVRP